jgi:hypothetical protein
MFPSDAIFNTKKCNLNISHAVYESSIDINDQ